MRLFFRKYQRVIWGVVILMAVLVAQAYTLYNLKMVEINRHKLNEKIGLFTKNHGLKYILRHDDFEQRKQFMIYAYGALNLFTILFLGLYILVVRAHLRLEREEHAKSEMISAITHNARHYLSVIHTRLDLLRLRPGLAHPDEKTRRDLQLISLNLQSINHLVGNLNQNEALANKHHQVHLKPVDLWPALQDAIDNQDDMVTEKNLHLALPAHDGSLWIQADRQLLDQALMNLLHNAVKFTASDSVVTIRCACRGDKAFLEIEDQGPGIPAAMKERIFVAYVRLQPHIRGTGLGLGNARQCMLLMGGEVKLLDSPAGRGAVFELSCPLAKFYKEDHHAPSSGG